MISNFAKRITEMLRSLTIIDECDIDLYQYGCFLLLSWIIFFLLSFLCGILFGVLGESIVFYIMFSLLRCYAGGFHARTENLCTALTTLAMVLSILGIKIMKSTPISVLPFVYIIIGMICIFVISPLDSKEKPLIEKDRRYYRNCSLVISVVIAASAVLAALLELHGIVAAASVSLFLEGILLLIGRFGQIAL